MPSSRSRMATAPRRAAEAQADPDPACRGRCEVAGDPGLRLRVERAGHDQDGDVLARPLQQPRPQVAGHAARLGYMRTSSDWVASSRRDGARSGHSHVSSAPRRRAASHRLARCGTRPRVSQRSPLFGSTPQHARGRRSWCRCGASRCGAARWGRGSGHVTQCAGRCGTFQGRAGRFARGTSRETSRRAVGTSRASCDGVSMTATGDMAALAAHFHGGASCGRSPSGAQRGVSGAAACLKPPRFEAAAAGGRAVCAEREGS